MQKVPGPATHTILVYYKAKYMFPTWSSNLILSAQETWKIIWIKIYVYRHIHIATYGNFKIAESCENFMPFKYILVNEDKVIFFNIERTWTFKAKKIHEEILSTFNYLKDTSLVRMHSVQF